MTDTPEFVDLIARLRVLLDSEYRRGKADATRRIMEAAQVEVDVPFRKPRPRLNEEPAKTNGAEQHDHRESGSRAPHGAPDALITRVLRERGNRGAGATEIAESAQSDVEKMVSLSGVRFALDRGKTAGKYRNDRGVWFLIGEVRD